MRKKGKRKRRERGEGVKEENVLNSGIGNRWEKEGPVLETRKGTRGRGLRVSCLHARTFSFSLSRNKVRESRTVWRIEIDPALFPLHFYFHSQN